MNINEDVIGYLNNEICKGGQTYSSRNYLLEILEKSFKSIGIYYQRDLYKSMKRMICDVFLNKGELIKY